MKIMIAGGYNEAEAETVDGVRLIGFAEQLAGQVIRQGHEIRCGNLSSLDEKVIAHACDVAEELGQDPSQVVTSYHPRDAVPRISRGGVNGSANDRWNSMDGRKLAVPEPIAQADVVILIGGFEDASGTFTAANWARQLGTPLLPVATFGMAAGEIYNDLPDSVERSKVTGLTSDDLVKLTRSKEVLTDADAISSYAQVIVSLAEKAALSREVFLIMSFEGSDDLQDYQAAVEQVCTEAGFEAVRTDSRPTNTHQIIESIHDLIQTCGFVIADLTNERPNVYYEIGYAMALGKKLVLTSKQGSEVHFDLSGYNRIEWSGSVNLRDQLKPVVAELAQSFGLSPG